MERKQSSGFRHIFTIALDRLIILITPEPTRLCFLGYIHYTVTVVVLSYFLLQKKNGITYSTTVL